MCDYLIDPYPVRPFVTASPLIYHSTTAPLPVYPIHLRHRYPTIFSRVASYWRPPVTRAPLTLQNRVVPGQGHVYVRPPVNVCARGHGPSGLGMGHRVRVRA